MHRLVLIFLTSLILLGCNSGRKLNYDKIEVIDFSKLEPMLNKNTDTVYIINFWATWCAPCVKEFPHFDEAARVYSDKKVKFLMVSLDFPNQLEKSLIPFVKSRTNLLPVVLLDDPNQNEWINKVNPAWSGALPATFIYRKSQKLFYEGPIELADITNAIDDLLVKP
jgi:thiol-disulfide isomerase/thioredoxin